MAGKIAKKRASALRVLRYHGHLDHDRAKDYLNLEFCRPPE